MFENYIGGRWLAPVRNRYLLLRRPNNGVRTFRVPRSSWEDVDRAFDEAHCARPAWSGLEPGERAITLARVADRASEHGLALGLADCCDRGASVFAVSQPAADAMLETLTVPLFRQLAAFEGEDPDWPSHTSGSTILKLALAAETEVEAMCRLVAPLLLDGHVLVVVLLYREGSRFPVRLLALMGIMAACLPPGVLNLVAGLGLEAGVALVNSPRGISASALAAPPEQTSAAIQWARAVQPGQRP